MIRKLIIFLLFTLSVAAHAQEKVTVVLKNGKVLEGKLVDALYQDFITIEYSALERDNIHLSKVKGIYFGEIQTPENQSQIQQPFFKREKGFFHLSEFQMMMGQDQGGSSFSNQTIFQTINGYAVHPWLMVGGGVGLDKYGDFFLSPVFASIRGNLQQKKVSPFYYLNAGWAHFWEPEDDRVTYDYARGGYHLQFGAGYQLSLRNSAILLSLGYRLQDSEMQYSVNTWDWSGMSTSNLVTEERLLRRMVMSLGFTF